MGDQSLHDLVHAELLDPGLVSKLSKEDLIVPVVRALEHLVNLEGCLSSLQALLNHVRAELQLAQAHKVAGNKVQDLVIPHVALQLQHVLHQVVAEWILDEEVNAADNHVGQGQLLSHETLLQTALHDTAAVLV